MRKILGIYGSGRPHWVGDGFPVRSIFSHATLGKHISPFLLLDYAGPAKFAAAKRPRGVGACSNTDTREGICDWETIDIAAISG